MNLLRYFCLFKICPLRGDCYEEVDLFFRAPFALSLGINHGLKYKFTRIVFLKLMCYLMAKKWVETRRRRSRTVDSKTLLIYSIIIQGYRRRGDCYIICETTPGKLIKIH